MWGNELIKYKEMEYKWEGESCILVDSSYNGYRFIIANIRGSHPAAYIELKDTHPLYGKHYSYDDNYEDIPVHGGLTYSRDYLQIANIENSWIIGWDYGHYGDFTSMPFERDYQKDWRKWTVPEIIEEDVIPAIKWLKEKEYA